mmetsp:Transcript_81276/g.214372  ORF Transcript_81276/g.214372 Transcript_81276/m.214372 type:complete len:349 (+) Transcript_81276:1-1047(+)
MASLRGRPLTFLSLSLAVLGAVLPQGEAVLLRQQGVRQQRGQDAEEQPEALTREDILEGAPLPGPPPAGLAAEPTLASTMAMQVPYQAQTMDGAAPSPMEMSADPAVLQQQQMQQQMQQLQQQQMHQMQQQMQQQFQMQQQQQQMPQQMSQAAQSVHPQVAQLSAAQLQQYQQMQAQMEELQRRQQQLLQQQQIVQQPARQMQQQAMQQMQAMPQQMPPYHPLQSLVATSSSVTSGAAASSGASSEQAPSMIGGGLAKPKGWDQCLHFARFVKEKEVTGIELVKTWQATCQPAVRSGRASERYRLMCNGMSGAIEPYASQVDYNIEQLCDTVLALFHDLTAADTAAAR